ncbi:MAG: pseudouridine synthase, partial [Pseudomonadota bacterium]
QQFAAHGRDGRLKRVYSALVWGGFPNPSGTIDLPLARSTTHRTRIAVARPGQGREAVTHYVVRDAFHLEGQTDGVAGVSHVDVMLETGRTHQIRVHMAAVRHPVLGDPVYASGYQSKLEKLPADAQDALGDLGRQALHARTLGFEHPVTRSAMEFDSALPPDMAKLLLALR